MRIHVRPSERLELTADPSGARPVYWTGAGDGIAVASRVDALRQPGDPVDVAAARRALLGVRRDDETLYERIRQVPAGATLRIGSGRAVVVPPPTGTPAPVEPLEAVVARFATGDSKLGIMLDGTAASDAIARCVAAQGGAFVGWTVDRAGASPSSLRVDDAALVADLAPAVRASEQPLDALGDAALWHVWRAAAASGTRVFLHSGRPSPAWDPAAVQLVRWLVDDPELDRGGASSRDRTLALEGPAGAAEGLDVRSPCRVAVPPVEAGDDPAPAPPPSEAWMAAAAEAVEREALAPILVPSRARQLHARWTQLEADDPARATIDRVLTRVVTLSLLLE